MGAAPVSVLAAVARASCIHPQGQRKAASTRDTGDCRPRIAGGRAECAGTGVGGAVRAAILRVPAGRGCHDAIEAIYATVNGRRSKHASLL
jgi:hypothetical protein